MSHSTMKNPGRRLPCRLLPVLLACVCGIARGAPEPKVEMTVQLPPFIIEHATGPRWRYMQIPRFEILSRCNDLTTEQLALAVHRANQLLGLVLPERFQVALDAPQGLIFYDQKLWPATEQAAVAAMLRKRSVAGPGGPSAPPRIRLEPVTGGRSAGTSPLAEEVGGEFFTNYMLADADTITTFALISESTIDPMASNLTPSYVSNLLQSRVPALSDWFTRGFMGLYRGMEFRGQDVTLRLGRWEGAGPDEAAPSDLASVGVLFAGDDDAAATNPGKWLILCERFVAWGLDPEGNRRDGFWQLVELAATEPVTEDLFRACLGVDFATAAVQLREHAATPRTLRWELPAERARLPSAPLDDASSRQVARIKGEWERLEARYVRRVQPDLEAHYVDLARGTLRKAYDRGDRDPRLLASLGLLEAEDGDKVAARGYLAEAVERGVVRPRAYYELARVRYDQIVGRSKRNDGKFPAQQVEPIVQPLLAGMKQSPRLAAAYELLAHVSALGLEPPAPEVLEALAEGARLFPQKRDRLLELALKP